MVEEVLEQPPALAPAIRELVECDFPAIILMPPGKVFRELRKLAKRLSKLQAETLVVSSEGARLPAVSRAIRVPGASLEIYTPIPYIVPGQVFAASLAEVKGLEADKPRSLRIVTRTI